MRFFLISGILMLSFLFLVSSGYLGQESSNDNPPTYLEDQEGMKAFYDTYIMANPYDINKSFVDYNTQQSSTNRLHE